MRAGLADKVKSLADFKGLNLMSAPGPANLNTAKGILAKVGLKDGDYTIDQLDMGQHINAMKAGTFDGGYTLDLPGMMEVLMALKAQLIIPMHFFSSYTLDRFLARAKEQWPVERADVPSVVLSHATLPADPKVLVLPGH